MNDDVKATRATLARRFGEEVAAIPAGQGPYGWPQSCPETWRRLAARGSCRRFAERPVAPELIETLCALALCAPTKSDLQQRDIVIVEEPARARINELLSTGPLGSGLDPERAGASRVLRQQPPAAPAAPVARQAVRQRSSRCLLQCGRRCRHCAFGLRAVGRGRGARLRLHQRYPQPRPRGERAAAPAGARIPGGRPRPRLAGARGSCELAPAAVRDRAPWPIRGERHPRHGRRLRPSPRGASRSARSAPLLCSAQQSSTAGRRTRCASTRGPSARTGALSCGARGSGSTRRVALRLLLEKPVDRAADRHVDEAERRLTTYPTHKAEPVWEGRAQGLQHRG